MLSQFLILITILILCLCLILILILCCGACYSALLLHRHIRKGLWYY
jgi:hypothetical protein